MPQSLVRVSKEAQHVGNVNYNKAVMEFVVKMGGSRQVIETILAVQQGDDTEDTTLRVQEEPSIEEENPNLAM